MKKIYYLFLAMLFSMLSALSASGQYVITQETEKVEIINSQGDKVVNIEQDEKSTDRVRVQVAGVELLIGQDKEPQWLETPGQKKQPFNKRVKLARPGHLGLLEVGINTLPSPNYSMYAGDPLFGRYGENFLELDHSRSWQWAVCPFNFSVKLLPYGILSLSSGIQLVWNNYTFRHGITLEKTPQMVVPKEIDYEYKKSKMSTFGFRIPVLVELNLPQRIFVAAGIYGGADVCAKTKVKKPGSNIKEKNPYMNTFYYGATVRLGYDSFYVYGNYDLSPLFEKNRGPEVYRATIGFGFAF